ncbi:HD domain-containing phosphohydrolase [Neptuniibacter sp. QD37_6]|uniref:HD domain-containing phosphohydrolase n=1 Tax=Neptuniibacter sp. QD37_6 TaxID=3398210 RepID=UPI0039F5CD1F
MYSKPTILIVDDSPDNIDQLSEALGDKCEIKATTDAIRAIEIAHTPPQPDLIILDVMMPQISGYEVCSRLKENPVTSEVPIIFFTSKCTPKDEAYGFFLGACDYITKPISPAVVQSRVNTHLNLHDQKRALHDAIKQKTKELNNTQLKILQCLGKAAEYKDNETGFHVIRMSYYARLIAEAYSTNTDWCELVFNAAPMHDIGKIGIPDAILLKPGPLTNEEKARMQEHSQYGADIIGNDPNPLLQLSRKIALSHHEKWDGSGYPGGLKEENIPIEGRIVAIADVFDALTSTRPYKKAWSVDKALSLISDSAGSHFDPKLVDLFLKQYDKIIDIMSKYPDEVPPDV